MIPKYQRGVAVVTALLLTTLAITIVASLFWQQQVQVRSIENQRFQLQKKWVLRGALDWARLILREDENNSPGVDHLGEPWAVTLGETQLDQYVENGKSDTEASEAALSGKIFDAQARYNLNNLALNGEVVPKEVEAFGRLLTNLRFEPSLAKAAATAVAATQVKLVGLPGSDPNANPSSNPNANSNPNPNPNTGTEPQKDTTSAGAKPPPSTVAPNSLNPESDRLNAQAAATVKNLRFSQVEDLLSVAGFTPQMVNRLRDFVAVLPTKSLGNFSASATPVNINTASAEVISARLYGVSLSDAALIVAIRDRAYFRDLTDFKTRAQLKNAVYQDNDVSVSTNFFFINGKVKLSRSGLEITALLERSGNQTKILWVKEN